MGLLTKQISICNCIIFIVLVFLGMECLSQNNAFRFDYITSKEGLSDNYITNITQDSYGFVWISTKGGLNRFDGSTMKLYKSDVKDSSSLPENYIIFCFEDSHKQLWVGTFNSGLYKYNRDFDNFTKIELHKNINNSLKGITKMLQFNDSLYLIGTYHGLLKYNSISKSTKVIYKEHSDTSKLGSNSIMTILVDNRDNIWIAYEFSKGLGIYDIFTDSIIQAPIKNAIDYDINHLTIQALEQITDSTLLIGTLSNGIYILDQKDKTISKIDYSNLNLENGMKGCITTLIDSDSCLWISTSTNDGLLCHKLKTNEIINYHPSNGFSNSLNSLSVSCMFQDSEKNLWFGTYSKGLNILNFKKNIFRNYTPNGNNNSLSHSIISSFAEGENGNVWIGTDGGGLNYFKQKTQTFTHFNKNDGLPSNAIVGLQKDEDSNLYIGMWGGALSYFNTTRNTFSNITSLANNPEDFKNLNLKSILLDNDTVYIATHSDGLYMLSLQDRKLLTRESSAKNLQHYFPILHSHKVLHDQHGNIWLANSQGLLKIEKDTSIFYLHNPSDSTSLSDNYIADIFEDDMGRIWIGTLLGLNLYDNEKRNFKRINETHKLNQSIKSIIQDNNGAIWCGTANGIIKIDSKSFAYKQFNTEDGIVDNQAFERSIFKKSNGDIYIGTINGFSIFNPNKLIDQTPTQKLYVTEFSIYNKVQKPNGKDSPLYKDIILTDTIYLKYNQNFISFGFTVIEFTAPQKIQYRYMLKGLEKEWNEADNEKTARYTNIPPGEYTFLVQATDSFGRWNYESKTISLIIDPPWWNTWWFKISSFLLFLLLFYLRLRRMKIQNKILEQKVRQRTSELQIANSDLMNKNKEIASQRDKLDELNKTKDKFFSIIGHDLKNPLNAMLGFADLLNNSFDNFPEQKKKKFIKIIADSSKNLLYLLENLLHWARSQSGVMPFNPTEITVNSIINENILTLKHHAEKKNISIDNKTQNEITVIADSNMISTVVRNLLSNAIKFTKTDGEISLFASMTSDSVVISVKDSGVGMNASQLEKLFKIDQSTSTAGTEQEAGTGLGLILCKEFVDKHNGKIWAESKPDEGTIFFIELPK